MKKGKNKKTAHSNFNFKILSGYVVNNKMYICIYAYVCIYTYDQSEAATTCFFSEKKTGMLNVEASLGIDSSKKTRVISCSSLDPLPHSSGLPGLPRCFFLLRRKSLYKNNWHLFFMANEVLIWSFTSKATEFRSGRIFNLRVFGLSYYISTFMSDVPCFPMSPPSEIEVMLIPAELFL